MKYIKIVFTATSFIFNYIWKHFDKKTLLIICLEVIIEYFDAALFKTSWVWIFGFVPKQHRFSYIVKIVLVLMLKSFMKGTSMCA